MTSEDMISKKESPVWLQNFGLRKENIAKKFQRIGVDLNELIIFEISSPAGGASTMKDLDALILTEETMKGGHMVNEVSNFFM